MLSTRIGNVATHINVARRFKWIREIRKALRSKTVEMLDAEWTGVELMQLVAVVGEDVSDVPTLEEFLSRVEIAVGQLKSSDPQWDRMDLPVFVKQILTPMMKGVDLEDATTSTGHALLSLF